MPYKDIEKRRKAGRESARRCYGPVRLEKQKQWQKRNPEKVKITKKRTRLKEYGLSLEAFNDILLAQNGRCAICNRTPEQCGYTTLFVDHDHTTKKVRGLLCSMCNGSLSRLEDIPNWAHRATTYLIRNGSTLATVNKFNDVIGKVINIAG